MASIKQTRQWEEDESKLLINLVEENYNFLFESLAPNKTKQMVDQKWQEIVEKINALGVGFPALSLKQVKKKWADIKSLTKRAVTRWNTEMRRTGGGVNTATKPTEVQFRIAAFIGQVNTTGIPGTENLDVAGQLNVSNEVLSNEGGLQVLSVPVTSFQSLLNDDSINVGVVPSPIPISNVAQSSEQSLERATPPQEKRRRTTPREQQTEELLQVEHQIGNGIKEIKEELSKTNAILRELTDQMKRANAIHEQIVGWMACIVQTQSNVTSRPTTNQ